MVTQKILVTGASGQLGSVLTSRLQKKYGIENVIASDLRENSYFNGCFERLDATDFEKLKAIISKYKITQIYHLAAILSANGEEFPLQTWDINMKTFFNILEVSRIYNIEKVFYPSSIAVFGDNIDKNNTLQNSNLTPSTVYGMSKVAGENWAKYYFEKYDLDIRSIRYPGIIGYQSLPGGGTTDYAVEIYHKAIKDEDFECFLSEDTKLPMIFMDDAIRATIELMEVEKEKIQTRTSYNLASMSFTPEEVSNSIQKIKPNFKISYKPDFRQEIAANWPSSINDFEARNEWDWKPKFNLDAMTRIMIEELEKQYKEVVVKDFSF